MATPDEAVTALRAFQKALPSAIIRGLRRGLRVAERLAKTKYMERKDNRHPIVFDPPNPPPGPLGIRSARLVRTVKVGPMRFTGTKVIGGLIAGNSQVKYARIHEKGGRAGRGGRSRIRPRPYLRPALDDARKAIEAEVVKEMRVAARATLQTIARGL